MKKVLKRTMSLLMTLCMLLSIFAVCASAATTYAGDGMAITDVTATANGTAGLYDIAVAYTSGTANTDVTILAYQGAAIANTDTTYTPYGAGMQIVYIDQQTINAASGTITFTVDTNAQGTGIVTEVNKPINIVMGGADVTTPAAATTTITTAPAGKEIASIAIADAPTSVQYFLPRTGFTGSGSKAKPNFADANVVVADAIKAVLVGKTFTITDTAAGVSEPITLTADNFSVAAEVATVASGFHTAATYTVTVTGLEGYTTASFTSASANITLDEWYYGDGNHDAKWTAIDKSEFLQIAGAGRKQSTYLKDTPDKFEAYNVEGVRLASTIDASDKSAFLAVAAQSYTNLFPVETSLLPVE